MKWLFTSPSILSSYARYGLSRSFWLSHVVGWLSHQSFSRSWIEPFIKDHQIDMRDFEVPLEGFAHFDAFFSRKLKTGARPFSQEPQLAIMPAEARYRRMENQENFEIKGRQWSLNALLGPLVYMEDTQAPSTFYDPLIARLCPTDYHRFHSPVEATVGRIIAMGDCLHSVHAWCLDRFPEVLSENKRVAIELLTDEGRWILVAIGATCVGSIELLIESGQKIAKGAELGSFHFGGSCLVVAHEASRWQEADDLQLLWKQHPEKEILSKMGEPMKIKT
jgi:phosphatidylserine decarboxylase